MFSMTENEAKVLDFLIRNVHERNSINAIGRRLQLSPRGIYKILMKLENNHIVRPERIGNASYYRMNLEEELAKKTAAFVLMQNDLNSYAKVQSEDFRPLREKALACILFGSIIEKAGKAGDIDILLVLEKKDFSAAHKMLSEIRELKPKKVHDVMLSKEDLIKSIRAKDEIIIDIIKKGKVLWGAEIVLEAIRDGTS